MPAASTASARCCGSRPCAAAQPACGCGGLIALRPRDVAELIALAALWGASFLFMRMGAAEFGPVALAAVRVAGAALLLLPLLACARPARPTLRRHWRPIAIVGIINSALPFLLLQPTRRCRSPPACRRSSTRRRRCSARSSPGCGSRPADAVAHRRPRDRLRRRAVAGLGQGRTVACRCSSLRRVAPWQWLITCTARAGARMYGIAAVSREQVSGR